MMPLLGTGSGDVTYNPRRNILGTIPVDGKLSYHLFGFEYEYLKTNYTAKLLKKANFLWLHSIIFKKLGLTITIDVCPSDGNLLAIGGSNIKIYDHCESKLTKIFPDIHSSTNSRRIWK